MEYSTVSCDWLSQPMLVVRGETTHQHWKDHADAEFIKNMQHFEDLVNLKMQQGWIPHASPVFSGSWLRLPLTTNKLSHGVAIQAMIRYTATLDELLSTPTPEPTPTPQPTTKTYNTRSAAKKI
jgi:hypothetical protein